MEGQVGFLTGFWWKISLSLFGFTFSVRRLCHRQPVYKVPVMAALHLAVSTAVWSANLQLDLRGKMLLSLRSWREVLYLWDQHRSREFWMIFARQYRSGYSVRFAKPAGLAVSRHSHSSVRTTLGSPLKSHSGFWNLLPAPWAGWKREGSPQARPVVYERKGLGGERHSDNDIWLIQVRFYCAGEPDTQIQIQQNLDFYQQWEC